MSYPRIGKALKEGSSRATRKSFKEVVKGTPKVRGKDVEMGGVCNGQTETRDKDGKETNLYRQKNQLQNNYLAKTSENPKYKVTSTEIGNYIQWMRDHALIRKFMGIWPLDKSLQLWINSRWKVKSQIDLQLGSKGFFIVVFSESRERDKVFEERPYFFNLAGLHMCFWTERFAPKKEDFIAAPVWIKMYSMSREFWEPEILEGIDNMIGSFVKIFEVAKAFRYISYARICVYMNVVNSLSESIVVSYQNEEWIQPLDYHHIPFRCRKCHVHGHLFKYFPLNAPNPESKSKEETDQGGFTNIPSKRKAGRRQPKQSVDGLTKNSTNNFKILEVEPSENLGEGNLKKKEIETKQGTKAGADLPRR
jgi:hypothetical protein